MEFVKYPHIDDFSLIDSKERFLDRVYEYEASTSEEYKWVVTEKIDGCNISFLISPNEISVAKRNSILESDSNFYDIWKSFPLVENLLKKIQKKVPDGFQYNLFCEFFGPGIQNRIYYGEERSFRFFSLLKINTTLEGYAKYNWLSYDEFEKFFRDVVDDEKEFKEWTVPILKLTKKFSEAMEFGNTFISTLTDETHNSTAEGTVIRPRFCSDYSRTGNLIVKNKNGVFKESKYVVGPSKEEIFIGELRNKFIKNYCTESRMYSVFSKKGNPTDMSVIKDYIKDFISDAVEDFVKEYPNFETFEEKDKKFIKNIGSLGFLLFKSVKNKIDETS